MNANSNESNYLPIVAYLTFIGWIIALIMNNANKDELTSFHLRQMLGLMLIYAGLAVFDTFIGFPILFWILYIGVMLLWFLGLMAAIKKEKTEIPGIGSYFQEWFKAL